MRRNSLFWGVLLVLLGGLFLLNTLGLFRVNIWSLIWPLFLILLGVWILVNVFNRPGGREIQTEVTSVPLEGAQQANVRIHHGAGRLTINGSAAPDTLAQGSFGGGLDYRKSASGNGVNLDMRPRWDSHVIFGFPWMWPNQGSLDWNVAFSPNIPLSLRLETGAGESRVNLSDMRVVNVDVETGASSTDLTLPSNAGMTRVKVEAGAASVNIHIPGGVAAQIHTQSGVSSISIDQTRFPRQGSVYLSPDYATATNKADIDIEVGVGSVRID